MFLLMNISIMNPAASIQVFCETLWMVHVGYDFFHPRVKKIKLPRTAHDIDVKLLSTTGGPPD